MSSKRIIKKYANRRLYDTEESRYITLKEIKEIVALGIDVQVIDDGNGEDLTRAMLLQIVSDQELGGTPLLNEAVLTQLIRFYGHPMQEMMATFINNSVKSFIVQQESMQEKMQQFIDASPMNSFQDLVTKNMQAMADMQRQFFGMSTGNKKTSGKDNTKEQKDNEL